MMKMQHAVDMQNVMVETWAVRIRAWDWADIAAQIETNPHHIQPLGTAAELADGGDLTGFAAALRQVARERGLVLILPGADGGFCVTTRRHALGK